jgi:intracellular sulfur oxidation DsrE/DsrF family protein
MMTVRSNVRFGRAIVAALVVATGVCGAAVLAQDRKPHRIVFEVTSADNQVWEAVLNNTENVQRALGVDVTEIRVVAHGKGIGLVMKTNTALGDRIAALTTPRVKFVACDNTMKRLKIQKDDLLPAAGTVDSGVAEVVRQQEAGWSYIKSGS